MSKIDPSKTLTDNLTVAANAYLAAHGVGEQVRTTITHGQTIGGVHWWVGSDEIVSGYGRNHRPEESVWLFEEIDGSYFVRDCKELVDALEMADAA